jgi:putative DNA primase/helicase
MSRVKYLTGLGQIKARRLREDMITFQPTYKLFLDCNHKPVITDPNDAIWNRVKCVPFKVEIVGDEIDKDLPDKLRTELPGFCGGSLKARSSTIGKASVILRM